MDTRLFGKAGVKGAFSAFISTHDTRLAKPTIEPGNESPMFFLRFVAYLKTALPLHQRPKPVTLN